MSSKQNRAFPKRRRTTTEKESTRAIFAQFILPISSTSVLGVVNGIGENYERQEHQKQPGPEEDKTGAGLGDAPQAELGCAITYQYSHGNPEKRAGGAGG